MARWLPNTVDTARAGSQAANSSASSGVASSDIQAQWWTEAENALFTQWGKAFENYNYSFYNPYFDYFYTGQDINVQIEASENILPIYAFGYNIQQQKTPLFGFWSYCVDIETEALTRRGWMNGNDLREDDMILSMDPQDKQLKWSSIKSIYRNASYDGKMFKLTGCGIDALVTPGHKFALTTGELKPIDEITHQDTIQIMGTAVETQSEVYTDAFVELVGWYITEGHDRKDCNAIEIVQSQKVNPHKLERIEFCLKRLDVDYSKYPPKKGSEVIKLYLDTKQAVINQLKASAPNKIPTYEFIYALSTQQRMILIDAMLDGDGSRPGLNGRQYGQGRHCVDQLDVLMSLCAMSGIATHKGPKTPNGQTTVTMKVRSVASGQRLNFNGGYVDKRSEKKNEPTVDYNGLVWCPETEYGTFVCRRAGRTYVTGNTYDAMLRGTRIVSGAFSIVSTEPFLLTKTIAEASVKRAKLSVNGPSDLNSIRGLDEDESRIDRFWRRNFDSNLDMGDQNLFSVHPPFNIIITYGLQETSLVSNDPNARVSELQANGYGQDAIMTDFNERLVKNPSSQLDRQVLLENVEIISKNVEYNVDGDPLLETYTFMARDERLLNIKDYSNMIPAVPDPPIDDDNIGPVGNNSGPR